MKERYSLILCVVFTSSSILQLSAYMTAFSSLAPDVAAKSGDVSLIQLCNIPSSDYSILNSEQDEYGLTPLHYAAKFNNINAIEHFLNRGADVNIRGHYEVTPLYMSARYNHIEAVEVLLKHGANPEIKDSEGDTALHIAAKLGFPDVCKILINKKPSLVNEDNNDMLSPLHLACKRNRFLVCQLLIENAANVTHRSVDGSLPIHFAAAKGGKDIINLLLDVAALRNIREEDHLGLMDYDGRTVLHKVVTSGNISAILICIRRGANIMASQNNGSTPLHLAASGGCHVVSKVLIRHGAKVNAKCELGITPLHLASSFGHIEVIKILLAEGADINAVDNKFQTPLMFATENGSLEAIKHLISQGADTTKVDDQNRNCLHLTCRGGHDIILPYILQAEGKDHINDTDCLDRTALHYAAEEGYRKIIATLLSSGATFEISDADDNLPIHLACRNADLASVKVLCAKSLTHLNSPGERSRTPLHQAIVNNNIPVVHFLIKFGANINKRDGSYHTPLYLAAERGFFDIAKALIDAGACINAKLIDGQTALHAAARKDDVEITELLLSSGADITRDLNNRTCLDVAIKHQSKNAALVIVKQAKIANILQKVDNEGKTVFQRLVEVLPEVAEVVMDRCIVRPKFKEKYQHYTVKYDFSYIDPGPAFEEEHSTTDIETDKIISIRCNALQTMKKLKRSNLVSHELSRAVLDHKWRTFGAYFFFLNLAIYLTYLFLLTYFAIQLKAAPRANNYSSAFAAPTISTRSRLLVTTMTSLLKTSNPAINTSQITTTIEPLDKVSSTFHIVLQVVVLIFVVINLVKEVYQIFHSGYIYFTSFSNYMEIIMYCLVILMLIPPNMTPNDWQWKIGSVALFLAWINLLLFMERISFLGLYVIMLRNVLVTFLKIITVVVIFIVAFSFVFIILAKTEDVFSTFPLTMVKVLVMMVGELDYNDTIVKAISSGRISYPNNILLLLMFVIFIFLMPILLMNLMIGLAIGDIDKIQKNAILGRLAIQIDFLDDLERSLPTWLRKKLYSSSVVRRPHTFGYKLYSVFYGDIAQHEDDDNELWVEEFEKLHRESDWQRKQIRALFHEIEKITIALTDIQNSNRNDQILPVAQDPASLDSHLAREDNLDNTSQF
ncbi:Transient receptor potential cation channel subfamily A member 1 [Trichoplax sp. H2]|nr:Transient receptor potential cation channel subfamily A member 1 [Trichoplax sp. H2]|eukprot:RDD38683.1 Transient receptor potential cation channel subfamily A member 1 [Trichoplax sp. H2]